MKSVLLIPLALAFSLVGCSNMSDNSLLTNDSNVDNSHVVNKDPLSTEVFIALDSASLVMSANNSSVEVSGNCYTSTYADNTIFVYNSGSAILSVLDLKSGTSNNTGAINANGPKCRDGRFAFVISPNSLVTGTNNLKIQLPVVDSSGKTDLNLANASRTFTVTKPN